MDIVRRKELLYGSTISLLSMLSKLQLWKQRREFRERAGLTQEDMEDYGIHERQYQRLESGRQRPSIPTDSAFKNS